MVDKIIKHLNQKVTEKISQNNPLQNVSPQQNNFADVLESKRQSSGKFLENMITEMKGGGEEFQVQSGAHIQVSFQNFDVEKSSTFSPNTKLTDLFGSLNEDMLSMDSAIEVLSDPSVRLSRRQLFAVQAGIQHMSINTELFSRLAQSISQNLNTLLNTQVA